MAVFRIFLVKRTQWHLISQLCRRYIDADFEFHLQHSSCELLRNANVEIQKIMNGVLIPLTVVVLSATVTSAVVVVLFWFEPVAAGLLFAATSSFTIIYFTAIQRKVATHSRRAQRQKADFIKHFNMVIGSLPEIRILGKEDFFRRELGQSAKLTASAQRFHMLGNQAVSRCLETVVTAAFAILIAFMAIGADDASQLAPALGLLAIGMIRIRGLAVQILSGFTQIQASHIAVGPVFRHLQMADLHSARAGGGGITETETMDSRIGFSNVSYRYPGAESSSISEVSFTVGGHLWAEWIRTIDSAKDAIGAAQTVGWKVLWLRN